VQRLYNYALQPMGRAEFAGIVTADQPDTPPYFTYDAVLNAQERPTLQHALERELRPLTVDAALELQRRGTQVLDTREPADFAGSHLAGAVNVGLGGAYATWCGTVLDREHGVVIVADLGREHEAAVRLGRIGFDIVEGYMEGGMQALDSRPARVARVARVTAAALDVRTEREWRENRIHASVNLPLTRLMERLGQLPRDRPIVVHCATGYRSAIAASLLLRDGFGAVTDLVGGLAAWRSRNLETARVDLS
jgi:rhodanese-related sulfurtransferase